MHIIVIFLIIIIVFGILFFRDKNPKNRNSVSEKQMAELKEKIANRRNLVDSDPNRITEIQIRSVLLSLNLSPFVIALFDETDNLENYGFYNYFKPPYTIIDSPKIEQDAFEIDRYIPLFETMDDFLEVLAYDKILGGFIRYSPEDNIPLGQHDVLTWDGIFVGQILSWYEDEKLDKEILKICGLLGLEHGRKILDTIYKKLGSHYTSTQITQWEESTLIEIKGIIK